MNVAPCPSLNCSGIGITRLAERTASSAKPPLGENTRSPIFRFETSDATSMTRPTISDPGLYGTGGLI